MVATCQPTPASETIDVGLPVSVVADGEMTGASAGFDAPVAPDGARWPTFRLWARRGAWAFADQTMFAFSNFILNVALARLLTPDDYGAFTIGYTIFLFVGTIYTSLIIEPLLVFGAGIFRHDLRGYVRALVRFHWLSTGLAGLAFLLAGAIVRTHGHAGLGDTVLVLSVAMPCILLQWLLRRACYVRFEPRLAAYAGIYYAAALVMGGAALHYVHRLGAASGILLMGAGSLASAMWLTRRLDLRPFTLESRAVLPGLVAEHWRYGRWVVAGSLLGWVPQSLYFLLLPYKSGLASTAELKALTNLVMPVLHAYQPMLVLMVPALVRQRNTPAFGHTVRVMLLLCALCACVYWGALGLFHRSVVDWLYHGQYVENSYLLWIIGLIGVSGSAVAVLGAALRALERSNHIFLAYAMSTLVTVTLGVAMLMMWGVPGAAVGVTLSSFATVATMTYCLVRSRSNESAERP